MANGFTESLAGKKQMVLCEDSQDLAQRAAEAFVELASLRMELSGRFTVALSGGSTPKTVYRLLAKQPARSQLDWSRVYFFWGDERCVPPDHQESNYRMARTEWLDQLSEAEEHVFRMEAEREDLDLAAREYQAAIEKVFSIRSPEVPSFDLILLGLGDDGHTASLFPHTSALGETERLVVLNYVPKLAANRMTFTVPLINHAAFVTFLVSGETKAAVLKEVLQGPLDPARLPSQLICPDPGRLTWMIDHAAAKLL